MTERIITVAVLNRSRAKPTFKALIALYKMQVSLTKASESWQQLSPQKTDNFGSVDKPSELPPGV